MSDLEAGPIVKPHLPQRPPVLLDHPCGCGAHLLGDRAERPLALRKAFRPAPIARLDRFDQFVLAAFDTQKLCVRLRSIVAVLRRRRNCGHHLSLTPEQSAGPKHDLHE